MKNLMILVSAFLILLGTGCKSEDVVIPAKKTTYNLEKKDMLGVSGTVTFIETSSTITTIELKLTGAPAGSHPAELCANSAVEGGSTIITLNPVDAEGISTTITSAKTYTELNSFDGFVQVHLSSSELSKIIAIGDIGGNVKTGVSVSYPLTTVGTFGVTGSALFEKRVNGSTLVTLSMIGLITGTEYPATISIGSTQTVGGGVVKKTLQNVNGNTGKSYTNIRTLDDTSKTVISYDNWLVYVGYINVYNGTADLENIIAHGNIGANK